MFNKRIVKKMSMRAVALLLSVMMLSGCANETAPEAPVKIEENMDAQEASTETTSDMQEEEVQAENTSDTEESENGAEQQEISVEDAIEFSKLSSSYFDFMGECFLPDSEMKAPEEGSEEEIERLDRNMRNYTGAGTSLLINEAKSFYYYDRLTDLQQDIYDTLYMLAQDPTDPNNAVTYSTNEDVFSDKFTNDFYLAYYAMLFDHPELFWLYNGSETDVIMLPTKKGSGRYDYVVYFYFTNEYKDFEKDLKAFNKAKDDFFKDIDLTQDDYMVARAIHDKLIAQVKYDFDVSDKNAYYADLAHTAYGALVANSRGEKNTAVCDGYSAAYVYLLQQAGIDAAMIRGIGGADEKSAGGHAWSVVKLGKDWYEVDCTWDDTVMDYFESYANDPRLNDQELRFMEFLLTDPACVETETHYMYNITTKEITNYKSSEDCWIIMDGKYYDPIGGIIGDSVHIRDSELSADNVYAWLMELAPTANGTKYR